MSRSRRIIRWYCVPCFSASRLKNVTLCRLSAIVTLTPSSRNASSSGRGRKSSMILGRPIGSSVYLILALIELLSFSPVTRAKDPDDAATVGEPHGHHAAPNTPEAVQTSLRGTMRGVLRQETTWVRECGLGLGK